MAWNIGAPSNCFWLWGAEIKGFLLHQSKSKSEPASPELQLLGLELLRPEVLALLHPRPSPESCAALRPQALL